MVSRIKIRPTPHPQFGSMITLSSHGGHLGFLFHTKKGGMCQYHTPLPQIYAQIALKVLVSEEDYWYY